MFSQMHEACDRSMQQPVYPSAFPYPSQPQAGPLNSLLTNNSIPNFGMQPACNLPFDGYGDTSSQVNTNFVWLIMQMTIIKSVLCQINSVGILNLRLFFIWIILFSLCLLC